MSGSLSPRFDDEALAAHASAADLVGLPWPERLRIVREDPSYSVPGFIALAISFARDVGTTYVEREKWARLGIEAASRSSSKRADELEPLAWAMLGDVRRLRGKLVASRTAFRRCQVLRRRLVDRLELAETCHREAGYWLEIGEFGKAADCSYEALRLASAYATDDVVGSYQILRALTAEEANDWSVAITMLLSALDRLDPRTNPRLALAAGHNLASVSIRLGHLDTAVRGILRLEPVYQAEAVAEPAFLMRRDWLFAYIATARGHWREAEVRLNSVRESLVKLRMPLGVARVDVELAELAATRGRWPTAAYRAAWAARALSALGSPHEFKAANRLSREAAKRCRGSGTLWLGLRGEL